MLNSNLYSRNIEKLLLIRMLDFLIPFTFYAETSRLKIKIQEYLGTFIGINLRYAY